MMALPANRGESAEQTTVTDTFEQLFRAEYARVVAIAYRVLADPYEAEDAAQEVFVSFHRRHAADAPYAAAWLHAAAVHTALNILRGKRRRSQREETQARANERLQGLTETSLDPQQALEEKEQRREVAEALAHLPARSAAVLALRYSGMSYAEVAMALQVNASHVGTLLRRAEVALHKELSRRSS